MRAVLPLKQSQLPKSKSIRNDGPIRTVSTTLGWFMEFTSIGGLSQFYKTNLTVSKSIWFVLMILGLILTCISVHQVFSDYFARLVSTIVKVESVPLLTFPAVTICNQNKIHCGNLQEAIESCIGNSSCLNSEKYETYCDLYVYGQCEPSVNTSEYFTHGQVISRHLCDEISINIDNETASDHNKKRAFFQAKFMKYYSRLSMEEAFALSHQPDKMFKKCTFESVLGEDPDCMALVRGDTKFFSPLYGFCYSFNFRGTHSMKNKSSKARETPFSGPFYGLSLEINIEGNYYLRNGLTENEGIVVILHHPHNSPLISSRAFAVMPNAATSLGLVFSKITRQKQPYVTNCTSTWSQSSHSDLDDKDLAYQTTLCQNLCMLNVIQRHCNCTKAELLDIHGGTPVTYCNQHPRNDTQCIENVVSSLTPADIRSKCVCPSQCEERKYDVHPATAIWPAKYYWLELASAYNINYHGEAISPQEALEAEMAGFTDLVKRESIEHIGEYVRGNFLQLNVYFETKTAQILDEIPKYNFFSFLASLGGAVSLYLGISFIVVFEVFEILIRLAFSFFGNSTR